jgi:hypothetical protein
MSAGQINTIDRRVRFPVVAAALASTFLIGAVAGAAALSVAIGGNHASSSVSSHAVLPVSRGDMNEAAYSALHPAAAARPVSRGDMNSAAYSALHIAVRPTVGGDMSAAAYSALHPASGSDMSAAAYAALHPASTAR